MKNIVITISRQYGSGGKTIGAMLAKELGVNCYSREILRMASEDSGVNAVLFSDERLKPDLITRLKASYKGQYPLPNDSSKVYLRDDALFDYQAKIIRKLADQLDKGVIFISSELEELIKVCNRMYVFYGGNVVKELKREEFDRTAILSYALGGVGNGEQTSQNSPQPDGQ